MERVTRTRRSREGADLFEDVDHEVRATCGRLYAPSHPFYNLLYAPRPLLISLYAPILYHWLQAFPSAANDVKPEARRRLDPVMREAGKRGLDVTKLHASQTPAWRNLRTRNTDEGAYYDGLEEEERHGMQEATHEEGSGGGGRPRRGSGGRG